MTNTLFKRVFEVAGIADSPSVTSLDFAMLSATLNGTDNQEVNYGSSVFPAYNRIYG